MPVTADVPKVAIAIVSRVTAVRASKQTLGTFAGVPYVRTFGVVSGVLDEREPVAGLRNVARDASGAIPYSAEFETIAPAPGARVNDVVYVDAENRGNPIGLSALDGFGASGTPSLASYPATLGNGFLQRHATSYARVQWQTGIAAGVPANAQGIGLAIVRDFTRMLEGRTVAPAGSEFATYHHAIFGGISQSAWFVNDFIAEGYNADPLTHRAVFDAAIAVDGTGNVLAINRIAARDGVAQTPYLEPNAVPLLPHALLARPESDPFYVDVANYTDFFRLRASVTDVPDAGVLRGRARRYDWPSPHAAAGPVADPAIFAGGCNGGTPIELDAIGYTPYLRALVLGMEREIGVPDSSTFPLLPASTRFALEPVRTGAHVNEVPGVALRIPRIDALGNPLRGVRFPDVVDPLGGPVPPSLDPVSTATISATCGNFAGFAPLSASALESRYGTQARYLTAYDDALKRSIAAGFLLPEDESGMLSVAASRYAYFASKAHSALGGEVSK